MTIKTLQTFETTDGTRFDTEEEASVHQRHIDNADRVEAFLNKNYPVVEGVKSGPSRAIARAAVMKWLEEQPC